MVEKTQKSDGEETKNQSNSTPSMSPVRLPNFLIALMDRFLKEFPELAINSRQELARRVIAEWMLAKRKELRAR